MAQELRDPPIVGPPIRLAVCVSGEGTTLQNLIDRIRSRKLRAEVVQVVASRPRIGAIARAEAARIPLALANYHARSNTEFSTSVFDPIRHSGSSWLSWPASCRCFEIPRDYRGRVINVHPSLIPAFCGKGFYGSKVHKAVIESGVKVSGCTVHFVDDSYDNGPIILQRAVPVLEGDTARGPRRSRLQGRMQGDCPRPSPSMPRAGSNRRPPRRRETADVRLQLDHSEQELVEPAQADRLATGERLCVADADQLAPVPGAVADRVDHPGPALGLIVDELRPKARSAATLASSWSEMSMTTPGRSTIRRCTLK